MNKSKFYLILFLLSTLGCQAKEKKDNIDQKQSIANKHSDINKEVIIQWFGHACFLITTSERIQILTDPVEFKGYHLPKGIEPDIVTISHNHPDHNRIDVVEGNPIVLDGTNNNIQKVNPIDTIISNIRIFTVPSYHSSGRFGMNAIFVIEIDYLEGKENVIRTPGNVFVYNSSGKLTKRKHIVLEY